MQLAQRRAAVIECLDEIGLERQRPVEMNDRFLVEPELVQHHAVIVEHLGMVRHVRQRLPDLDKGLVEAPEMELTETLQMQRAGIGLDREGLVEARDRSLVVAGVEIEQRAAVERLDMAWVGLEGAIEAEAGFLAPPQLL